MPGHFAAIPLDGGRLDGADPAIAGHRTVEGATLVLQHDVESLLASHAERLGVVVRRGETVTSLTQDAAGVTLETTRASDGRPGWSAATGGAARCARPRRSPFRAATPRSPAVWLGADAALALVVALQTARGVGVSFAGLPVMPSAYAVSRDKLGDATAQANMLQRVGGALGSALFVILLSRHGTSSLAAFQLVFAVLAASAAVAVAPATWLAARPRVAQPPR